MPENLDGQILHSTLASDPDYLDLIQDFVDALPEKIKLLEAYVQQRQLEDLQRLCHQLRGACGGYGYQSLTVAAGQVEELIKSGYELEELREPLESFAQQLSLVRV